MSFSDSFDLGNSTFFNLDNLESKHSKEKNNHQKIINKSLNVQPDQDLDLNTENFITDINFSALDDMFLKQNNESFLNRTEKSQIPAEETSAPSIENESFIMIEDVENHIKSYVNLNIVKNEIQKVSEAMEPYQNKLNKNQSHVHRYESTEKSNKTLLLSSKQNLSLAGKTSTQNSKVFDRSFNGIEVAANNEEQRYLSKWNLSNTILQEYKKKGVTKMFQWQLECLSIPKVIFEHANLIYSAPTSAGKTLVSELLIVKTLIERNKKAILILPFISVVREKLNYLQDILSSSGYKIEGYYGGYNASTGFDNIDLAICTIEKANSIINKLLEHNKLDNLGTIVIDEIHLISDKSRGYILEILLSKILYLSRAKNLNIQIIAMSATLANASLLQNWLQAELYQTDFRPVELKETIKISNHIYDSGINLIRSIESISDIPNDQDHIAQLCIETISEGSSILIFCPSKDWCESLCLHIANSMHYCLKNKTNSEYGEKIRKHLVKENLREVKRKFEELSTGFDNILEKTLLIACAFHHAGLTFEERELIEVFFKSGSIKVIVATSTLSSGVNLPARRVIIRSPVFGGKPLNSLTYKQMIGRAGRTGQDTVGESILICNDTNSKIGKDLFNSKLEPVTSCLHYDNFTHFKRAFLEAISSNIVTTQIELIEFSKCTLFYTENLENPDFNINGFIGENIAFLKEYEFIQISKDESGIDCYIPSRLGHACLASSIPPKDALILLSELQKARRCFALESELHAVYLVTPYSVCYQLSDMDWLFYLELWEKLSAPLKRVGELIGIKESFLVRAMRGSSKLDYHLLQIHKRFYIALALQDLINEVPISKVAYKFQCTRGLIQSLQQISSTFAGIVTQFCYSLKWDMLALIISEFKERLYFGVQRDLIDLTRLSELNCQRARAFHNAGIENLNDLARSNTMTIKKILLSCVAFESEKNNIHEDNSKNKESAYFYITGHPNISVTDAAKLLILNARNIIQIEMGVEEMKWIEETDDISKSITTRTEPVLRNDVSVNDISKSSKDNSNLLIDITENATTQAEVFITENVRDNSIVCERMDCNSFTENMAIQSTQENETFMVELVQIEEASMTENYDMADDEKTSKNESIMDTSENELNMNFNISDIEQSFQNVSIEPQPKIKHINSLNICEADDLETLWNENSIILNSNLVHDLDNNNFEKPDAENKIRNSLRSTLDVSNLTEMSLMNCPNLLSQSEAPKVQTQTDHISSIHIIDICGDIELFRKSVEEILRHDLLGLSFSLEKLKSCNKLNLIGANLLINLINNEDRRLFECENEFYIDGISIALENNIVLYLNLQNTQNVPQNLKFECLNKIFHTEKFTLNLFDAKEQLKILYIILANTTIANSKIQDPKIVNWLLNPDDESNLKSLTKKYAPQCYALLQFLKEPKGYSSIGLDYTNSFPGYIRSSVEACISNQIFNAQSKNVFTIGNGKLRKFFYDLEMPMQIILSRMEHKGFAVNQDILNDLILNISETLKLIQKRIYQVHGKQFNIDSVAEVAKILGIYKKEKGKYSTSKQILEKVDSPIADLIINYRKLKFILTNNIYPLMKAIKNDRIHANSNTFTSTGRITMHEPNVQNVARNFEINIDTDAMKLIACRSAFLSPENYSLIAADFCQLEIRVLTHLSQDPILMSIVRTNTDLFTSIAAKWNKLSETEVSSKIREATKQVCYGIIYGMGIKALSEALKCSEPEALLISEQFHRSYPGIREYIEKIKKFAKQNGYVETITGRRRYLPSINSEDGQLRAKSERQAINTIIQGSAADIVKSSILRMDKNIIKYHNKIFKDNDGNASFVLHVHDELIYEIPSGSIHKFAKIFKLTLESTVRLTIPLKVKLRVGRSWGELQDYIVQS